MLQRNVRSVARSIITLDGERNSARNAKGLTDGNEVMEVNEELGVALNEEMLVAQNKNLELI